MKSQIGFFISPFRSFNIKCNVNIYAERGISLNKEYNSRYQKNEEHNYELKEQQFFPGGPGGPGPVRPGGPGGPGPGRPGGPGGPGPGRPGGPGGPGPVIPGGQPMSPPPNFTPQLPRMEAQPFAGQRGGDSRNIRRCMNQFTFIWLFNGNSFWFFPVNIRGAFIEGFRWRRNRWEFTRINRNRILFFLCF